jgi:hypothetical protein
MDSLQLHALSGETHKDWIVVEDPTGEWWEGALTDAARARQLAGRGVVLLPVVPEFFRVSGVGGYFSRSFGSGFPLSRTVPMFAAPCTVALDSTKVQRVATGSIVTTSELHWRARLVPVGEAPESLQGTIRMASDSAQSLARFAPVVPGTSGVIDVAKLGKPDERGSWMVGGKLQASCPSPGHYGFSLYGYAPGLAVAWVACSVTVGSPPG